ncbi:MAG: META domain-containing protein [Gammaproteobacteria bacterium]
MSQTGSKTGFWGCLLAFSLVSQASCIGMNNDASDQPSHSNPVLLEQGQPWRLTTLAGQSVQVQPPITMSFSREGRINGYGGCNQYFGIFTASPDGTLTIGQVGATKKFCLEQMELEQRFFQALASVTRFTIDADQLRLSGPAGNLEFEQ